MNGNQMREIIVLYVNQSSCVNKVLGKFTITKCKPVTSPFANHFKLSSEQSPKTDEEFDRISKIPYANTVNSIMYLMICIRPNLLIVQVS